MTPNRPAPPAAGPAAGHSSFAEWLQHQDTLAGEAYRVGATLLPALLVTARSLTDTQRLALMDACSVVVGADPGAWRTAHFIIRATIIRQSHFGQPGPDVEREMTELARIHPGAYAAGGALLLSRDRPDRPGSTPALLSAPWTISGLDLPHQQP